MDIKEVIRGLLDEANIDLKSADILYSSNLKNRSLFFIQQAYEKTLKAYLMYYIFPNVWEINEKMVKNNSLRRLLQKSKDFKYPSKFGHDFYKATNWWINFLAAISHLDKKQAENIFLQIVYKNNGEDMQKYIENMKVPTDLDDFIDIIMSPIMSFIKFIVPYRMRGMVDSKFVKEQKINFGRLIQDPENLLKQEDLIRNEIIDQIKTEPKLLEISENPEYKEIFEKLIIKIIKEVSFVSNFETVYSIALYCYNRNYESITRYGKAENKNPLIKDIDHIPEMSRILKNIISNFYYS